MKKSFNKFFRIAIIIFVICAMKIENSLATGDQQTLSITAQKIVDEISPFIDEDTAIICYVNLLAMKDCYKFINVVDRLSKVESFHEKIRYYFTLLGQTINKKNIEKYLEQYSKLIENNVTHTYIILNMRDLKFGAYFVFPDVQKNSDKAKSIEEFFQIKKDNTKNNITEYNKQQIWSVYEKKCMIVGGQNFILSEISTIYLGDDQIVQMLLLPQITNAICGYNNLSLPDRKEYIKKRFENFKSINNGNFQRGIEEVNDCNFIKSVFLFPDSVAAWELTHLKKMDSPLNKTTFDFLKSTRNYVAFGVDTNQPKVKLTVECKSSEDAIKFKNFIDDTWRNIVNNYFTFFYSKNIQWSSGEIPKPMSPSDWAKFFVILLPKPKANKLITVIDQNFKK